MRVTTDPSIPEVDEKLSRHTVTRQEYEEAKEILKDKGYMPKSAILKRSAIPPFGIGVPLKLVADWDVQIEGTDMLLLLREFDEYQPS
jgi:hypothetical protein